jgi:acyl-CoA dehydrogenase
MERAIQVPRAAWMTEELDLFADAVDEFILRECVPHIKSWRANYQVPRETWLKAGLAGLLMASSPTEYGGGGGTFAHEAIIIDRFGYHDAAGMVIGVQNVGVAPYVVRFATEAQKRRLIPKMASGEMIGAMGITESGAGSDLKEIRTKAVRKGDSYVINGQKSFTTLGRIADLVMLACKTNASAGAHGISLFMVETGDLPGFRRGKPLDTVGTTPHAACELFFQDVRVPTDCLLGGVEGQGFAQLMTNLVSERLISTLEATAMIERALRETLAYVKGRRAFGKAILDFQNTQFVLAECKTEATLARTMADYCIGRQLDGTIDGVSVAKAKLWISEAQNRVVDRCLQLFGGYGYINDYPIAHMFKDARTTRIGGGTSEIMRLIIARSL